MKCVIPGGNVKILAKAIQMLAKIGDEMYVNPQQESISFCTVNMAKSAYSNFTFYKNFFSYYTVEDLEEEEEAQKCKISMMSAMTVFKSAHILDKQVETCHIHLEVENCNLVFILKYKNGINKSHLIPILDSEKLQASYAKAGMTNEIICQARTLMDALQNFPQSLIEITLEIMPNKLFLRNFVDEASVMANTMRTQLVLGVREFDRYTVDSETIITFCLKEVRALLTFSESVGVHISLNFETAGRPILFTLKNQCFEANLLLSTLIPDSDSQTDTSVVSRPMQSIRKRNASSRSTSSRVNKSTRRTKKSAVAVNSVVDNATQNRSVRSEEKDQADKTFSGVGNDSMRIDSAEASTSRNNARERNMSKPEQSRPSNPASTTSSLSGRSISKEKRKLVNTVFSSITKRKSTSDDENHKEEEEEDANLEGSVPCSPPPRQIAKKAKLVFQKCFQATFDPRMLSGHDIILVEDSDENNSD
ncbi:cell cycle checkpoint control protein RAD9A [Linepithema humile]|uniref:cell cycle checkpoint control protein RAD9A n=1 Tax=Linepithema humile TaxID=83485 RepID=UPI0006233488|nr:PREDICTED: cell cycle checkpoint control protein RAD9A [Linepithema humile]